MRFDNPPCVLSIVLRADIKPIVDGEAAHRAASPSISVLTYLRIAIFLDNLIYPELALLNL